MRKSPAAEDRSSDHFAETAPYKSLSPRVAGALAALFAIQTAIFYGQLTSQITPFYPQALDQLQYLTAIYELLGRVYREGMVALWHDIFSGRWPQHATFSVQGALMALIGGPTRGAIVSLNLVYFLALQAMLFVTIIRKTARLDLAWLGVALVLTTPTIFRGIGGIFDLRLDFGAICLFGIWVCAVLRTNGFRDPKWSVIAGLCAALLVSTRFITVTYIVAIGAAVLCALLLISLRTRNFARPRNLLLSAATLAIVVGPMLYAARSMLYGYYGIGHILGPERAIRVAGAGLQTVWDHLAYYPQALSHHLGTYSFILTAAILLLVLVQRKSQPRAHSASPIFDIAFLVLCIVGTLAVLTAAPAKSGAVAGIVLAPCVLLVVVLAALISPARRELPVWLVGGATACAALVFTAGANVAQRPFTLEDLRTIARLNTAAVDYIEAHKLTTPRIAIDRIQDFLNTGTVWIEYQERDVRRTPIRPGNVLGWIFSIERDRALSALASSDISFLSDESHRPEAYPFHISMREHWPAMQEYAQKNMTLLAEGRVFGANYFVYARTRN